LGDAATELRAFDVEFIAQGPQQGHLRLDIEAAVLTVDVQFHDWGLLVTATAFNCGEKTPFAQPGNSSKLAKQALRSHIRDFGVEHVWKQVGSFSEQGGRPVQFVTGDECESP
jgi:hypothetical protein